MIASPESDALTTTLKVCPHCFPKQDTLYPETGYPRATKSPVSGYKVACFGNQCGQAITSHLTTIWNKSNQINRICINQTTKSGRPYGATAVLVRHGIAVSCYRIVTGNPRITCICLKNVHGPDLIICSVYMPWSDRSPEQVLEYEACVGCLQAIVDRHLGCQFLFGSDFNVSKNLNSIRSAFVNQFVESNRMLWLDVFDGECDYTYHNDANQHYILLDYFLASPSLVDECQSVKSLCDGDNPSDHLAISCTINVALGTTQSLNTDLSYSRRVTVVIRYFRTR